MPEREVRLRDTDLNQPIRCAPPFTTSALPGPDTDVTVLDLFSGLGNGLAGAVRSGDVRVGSYRACERNPLLRSAALHNLSLVSKAHPLLLPESVLTDPLVYSLPQDVRNVLEHHLIASGVMDAPHLLVFGTWECQARSLGGKQLGIRDHRHSLVRHLHRVLSLVQKHRLCKGLPPANVLLENVVVSPTLSSPWVKLDQQVVERLFGRAVTVDSSRFGSRARRVRAYWCSFMPAGVLQRLVDSYDRPTGLLAQDILDPGRATRPARRTETSLDTSAIPGFYPCNKKDQPLLVLPTLVSHRSSYAYSSPNRDGLLLQASGGASASTGGADSTSGGAHTDPDLVEPNADERERCLGMLPGSTAAAGMEEDTRCAALGQTLDLNAVISLFALARAWHDRSDELLVAKIENDLDFQDLVVAVERPEVQNLLEKLDSLLLSSNNPPGPLSPSTDPSGSSSDLGVLAVSAAGPEPAGDSATPLPLPASSEPDCIPEGFKIDINPDLPEHSRQAFLDLIHRNLRSLAFGPEHCFGKAYTGGTFTVGLDKYKHPHCFSKARRMPDVHAKEVDRVVAELRNYGVVCLAPDTTNYASALVVAPKKDSEGNYTKWRVCVDYRPLNLLCSNRRYQMPLAEEIFASQTNEGQNMFSTGDIMWGFHAIKMDPADQELTSFWGPAGKLYMYLRGPFGLKNLPAFFQETMDRVFSGLAPFFIDDFLRGDLIPDTPACPYGHDCSAHISSLEKIFQCAAANGLVFSAAKLHLGYAAIDSLGHRVVHDLASKTTSVAPQMNKCASIAEFPAPTSKSELQTFLGMAGYYRKYLREDYSRITTPLRNLLAKNVQWSWGHPQQSAFEEIKARLISPAVLKMPVKGLPYRLATDWSEFGYGAVLSQVYPDGSEYPVAFASRACNKHEKNYASYKGEMMAAVWAVEHFRMYLLGQSFTLVTDHQPLSFLMKSQKLSGLYARWACRLQEYDITVVYRPGSANCNADGISRFPLPASSHDWEVFREGIDYYTKLADPDAPGEALDLLPQLDLPLADPPSLVAAVLSCSQVESPQLCTVASLQSHDGLVELGELDDLFPPAQISTPARMLDIHADADALHYLKTGSFSANLSPGERHRVQQRVVGYKWIIPPPGADGGTTPHITRRMTIKRGGITEVADLIVPCPQDRAAIIHRLHGLSHLRLPRTYDLVVQTYWWYGLKNSVQRILRSCPHCCRTTVNFSRPAPELKPLPIRGIGFSLHIDLAGPFVESMGCKYFMVVVDRTTKYLEVEPIRNKEALTCARALERVWLYRWGCPAEIVHDCGREWEGQLKDLLHEQGIDARYTSPNTPQSNGQAEINVRTVKNCLQRCIDALPDQDRTQWAVLLPRLTLSYNASVHSSTKVSPYFFITGRHPVIPFALEHLFREPLTFEPDQPPALQDWLQRADAIRRHSVMALGNADIAKHRQKFFWSQSRTGAWERPTKMFRIGDGAIMYIYNRPNLDHVTTSDPLRVLDIRPNNILVLQGICGGVTKDNMRHWGPYLHGSAIPLIDTQKVRDRLAAWIDDGALTCWVCDDATSDMDDPIDWVVTDKLYTMVQCSLCANVYHLSCISLTAVPAEDDWRCPTCVRWWRNPPGETFYRD